MQGSTMIVDEPISDRLSLEVSNLVHARLEGVELFSRKFTVRVLAII